MTEDLPPPSNPPGPPTIRVAPADLARRVDAEAILRLLRAFAMEPVSGGRDLPEEVASRLVEGLRRHPVSRNWIAWDGAGDAAVPVGCAICQIGFSTFLASPTLNLHDLFVLPSHRDRGVGAALMASVHDAALALGCSKVTLEVNRGNAAAQRFYARLGYGDGTGMGDGGGVWFWHRRI
jgi:GNAT superfamily N-acetyltransferase